MWLKVENALRWVNLDAIAEVMLQKDAYGKWELAVREPGSPVPKVVVGNMTDSEADSIAEWVEEWLTPVALEEKLRRSQRPGKEA